MEKLKHKYIFVIGGVLSGVGKGITTASLGNIFKSKGFKVTAIKADPYINVDAGTMNPVEHGEVFVTDDGDETDQDMGNYERFLDVNLSSTNYMTTGRVYTTVIENERSMKYKGKCVQVVPHIPEEIIKRIEKAAENNDAEITLIEIGGTVGEYENIISAPDVSSIYEIPLTLEQQDIGNKLLKVLDILPRKSKMNEWKKFVARNNKVEKTVKIAVIGKYFGTGDYTLADSYVSVIEA